MQKTTKILCDICQSPMNETLGPADFTFEGTVYRGANAKIYVCPVCGFKKLGTCQVSFEMPEEKSVAEDDPAGEEKAAADTEEPKKQEPENEPSDEQPDAGKEEAVPEKWAYEYDPKTGKRVEESRYESYEWIDYMYRKSKLFRWQYDHLWPVWKKERKYLDTHKVKYSIYQNDILYDTDASELVYTMYRKSEEGGKSFIKRYYLTPQGRYFSITTQYNRPDLFEIQDLKAMKQVLAREPEIYKMVIPEAQEDPELKATEQRMNAVKQAANNETVQDPLS